MKKLAVVTILLLSWSVVAAQEKIQYSITNWQAVGDSVWITYDLLGPSDADYDVSVVLLRESDPKFRVVPKTVWGDIGSGGYAGRNRKIIWYYLRDVPGGFQGDDYSFLMNVKKVEGSSAWYYIGGAALVGGGAAAYFLLGKKESTTTTPDLPAPPGLRPN